MTNGTPLDSAMKPIGLILALLLLVACSSSGPSKYGAQYLRIIAPANTALTRFQEQLSALGSDPARSEVAKTAAPLVSTMRAVDEHLLRASWPQGVDTDIKVEVAADAAIRAELSAAGARPDWEGQLHTDESKAGAKARIVRADLHLRGG